MQRFFFSLFLSSLAHLAVALLMARRPPPGFLAELVLVCLIDRPTDGTKRAFYSFACVRTRVALHSVAYISEDQNSWERMLAAAAARKTAKVWRLMQNEERKTAPRCADTRTHIYTKR